jgi:hypothetical protein
MTRYRNHVARLLAMTCGLLAAAPARAASLQQVSDWGRSGVPSYVDMYIYVPDKPRIHPSWFARTIAPGMPPVFSTRRARAASCRRPTSTASS